MRKLGVSFQFLRLGTVRRARDRSMPFALRCDSRQTAATGASPSHASPQPGSSFVLSALPLELQREFDVAENRLTLQHLRIRPHGQRSGTNPNSTAIVVKPTWTHAVTWRCLQCGNVWDARPADRLNPQVADQHGCPHCAAQRAAAQVSSPTTAAAAPQPPPSMAPPQAKARLSAKEENSPESEDRPVVRSLLDAYPALAAQWSTLRNAVPSNRVDGTVSTVPVTSRMQVWWSCPLCAQSWNEAVCSRVSRFVKGVQRYGEGFIPLCPSCEARGSERRVQDRRPSSPAVKRVLADDPALLAEAQLRPHQAPNDIALTAETLLNWKCRYCQHTYQASVANRFLRYERCPQCTGKVRTPYNLLVVQRPDVLREVAKTISRTALSYVTVHDTKELPFVCRVCFAPYRMSARTRCAVPPGGIACPKCLLNASQVATQLARQTSTQGAQHGGGAAQTSHPNRRRVQRRKAKALVARAGRRERSGETLGVTRNELRMRDHSLRD